MEQVTTETAGAALRRSRAIEASPVYYGWVVLAAATLGMAMTTPGQTTGVSGSWTPSSATWG